jgi:acetate kinase
MARIMTQRLRNRQQSEEAQVMVEEAWQRAPDPYGLRLSTAGSMKILVINSGSSSLKYSYFDTVDETNNVEGLVERIGLDNSRIVSSSEKHKINRELGSIDHSEAFRAIVELITDVDDGVIENLNQLTAVGHRVVHGGDNYNSAVIINDKVIADIDKNSNFAPLHNPINLLGIKEVMLSFMVFHMNIMKSMVCASMDFTVFRITMWHSRLLSN